MSAAEASPAKAPPAKRAQAGEASQAAERRKMLRKSYPLRRAAELGDGRMVEHLLAEGADPSQKNSSGLTASQVATKKNKGGSHGGALRALGGA